MQNYFNQLSIREQQLELGKCRLMQQSEFSDGVSCLKGKKIIIVGCGAQGLNQGRGLGLFKTVGRLILPLAPTGPGGRRHTQQPRHQQQP